MTFNFSFAYSAVSGDFSVRIYPQHVRASRRSRHVFRRRWFAEITQGKAVTRFSRPLGTDGIIAKIAEFGFSTHDLNWIATPYATASESPWKSHIDARDCVYFILAVGSGRVKIGCAKSLRSRYEVLVAASPFPLEILYAAPGSRQTERELHKRFAQYRVCNEWFFDSDEIRKFISENSQNSLLTNV